MWPWITIPIELDRDTFLKRTLTMELVQLDELQQAFREKALVDQDTAAAPITIVFPPTRSPPRGSAGRNQRIARLARQAAYGDDREPSD